MTCGELVDGLPQRLSVSVTDDPPVHRVGQQLLADYDLTRPTTIAMGISTGKINRAPAASAASIADRIRRNPDV